MDRNKFNVKRKIKARNWRHKIIKERSNWAWKLLHDLGKMIYIRMRVTCDWA